MKIPPSIYIVFHCRHWFPLFFLIWLPDLCFFAQTARAQNDERQKVQAASRAAIAKADQGDFKGSLDIIQSVYSQIPETKENKPHLAYLEFNLGYLYNHYGFMEVDDYIGKSIHYYQRSISYEPNNLKTLNNLAIAFEQNTQYDSSIWILKKMSRLDPANEGLYLTMIGDLYHSMGNLEKSKVSYQRALLSDNPPPSAGLKIIDLYKEDRNASISDIYKQCLEFEKQGNPEIAKPGYEQILLRAYASERGNTSERINERTDELYENDQSILNEVVLNWLSTTIQLEYVSPSLLVNAGLESVELEPIRELQQLFALWALEKDPYHPGEQLRWWKSDARRNFYLLAFEKSYADHIINKGRSEYAIQLYEHVLDRLWSSQDFSRPIFGREDMLLTDLVVLMARIYNNPKFKNEDKWRNLEEHILREKGAAFQTNDLANRQKFHTILGQIYLERGEFTGGGYRNARFQLENAISVAMRRAESDPSLYRPLPNLYYLLGNLHDTLQNRREAYDAYVNAALGYLESDNIRYSGLMIEKASIRNQQQEFDRSKLIAVETIYKTRAQIPTLNKDWFDQSLNDQSTKQPPFPWLTDRAIEFVIPSDILERQRFKTLSDLSARAAKVEAAYATKKLSDEARNSAKNVKVMTTRQDEIRLRGIDTQVNSNEKQLVNPPDNFSKDKRMKAKAN